MCVCVSNYQKFVDVRLTVCLCRFIESTVYMIQCKFVALKEKKLWSNEESLEK